MKTYDFERVKTWGFFGAEVKDHRTIINEYAAKGYRYVGFIPTSMTSGGNLVEIDLIFEMDCEEGQI